MKSDILALAALSTVRFEPVSLSLLAHGGSWLGVSIDGCGRLQPAFGWLGSSVRPSARSVERLSRGLVQLFQAAPFQRSASVLKVLPGLK